MATDRNTVRGQVLEGLRGAQYLVQIGERKVICNLSGKMTFNKISVIVGDQVDVVLPPGDRGRIVRRL